ALREPAQDLARDDARVAPRTHQGAVAHGGGDPFRGSLAARRLGLIERSTDGREHVGAGIAVGDREYVQGVDLVDVILEVRDRAPESVEETGPGALLDGHQATSVPLAARSSGATVARPRFRPAAGG